MSHALLPLSPRPPNTMSMSHPSTDWTVEMVHALPEDGLRYEVIDGELFVTPAPTWTHQDAVLELVRTLDPYLLATGCGALRFAPAAIRFGSRTEVQPDLFVVPLIREHRPRTWEEAGRLLLAVEVLSPSSVRADREVKRQLYLRERVPEYWVVNADKRIISRWRSGSALADDLHDSLEWQPDPAHAPRAIDLRAFFSGVHGE